MNGLQRLLAIVAFLAARVMLFGLAIAAMERGFWWIAVAAVLLALFSSMNIAGR